jgi:hypothetical protein
VLGVVVMGVPFAESRSDAFKGEAYFNTVGVL